MSIYQEISNWSLTKPAFIQDALRRIITNTLINQNDIDELVQLLKKENGDTLITLVAIPLDSTHIPTSPIASGNFPKLISLRNPINISALHHQGNLQFANNGLTVVYGKNGSGKSSYSRILKKLCWSRHRDIELKKNVFTTSASVQQVEFILEENGANVNINWIENTPSNPLLNSIFVYDNDCGDIYINKENPTEYKPIGIDVLERLISVIGKIHQSLSIEVSGYNTSKPIIDQALIRTTTSQWYANIENLSRNDIETYIQFNQANLDRKQELITLINTPDPEQSIQNLTGFRGRINNYISQITNVENLFNEQNLDEIRRLRIDFESTNQAYQIAANELSNLNSIEGFGTNPWRSLWQAAKNFADSNNMTDGQNFPSLGSLETCVLCQQDLDETAKERLLGFNQFVLNDISTQLNAINTTIQQKLSVYRTLTVPPYENFVELEQHIPHFNDLYNQFNEYVRTSQELVTNHLQNGGEFNFTEHFLSTNFARLLPFIEAQIEQNRELSQNRNRFINELNELTAKEFLFNNKTNILQYYDEYKYKSWITSCQSHLNTSSISRKIGELMENQAVNLQHQEFISHLSSFNSDLATKVLLAKTRTTQGSTYQKCSLTGISDAIDSILSEGEQKIIALSNFLAECTIDGRLNSIIFDDPVTSLDMDYRDLIANKIVQLSQSRQIIVFTHDLSFLRLLIDIHKSVISTDCSIIGIDRYNNISGIVTDEIPYLAKNVQERIDSIRRIIRDHDSLELSDAHGRETKLDSARKRYRMLLERSVEEILSNKTYERFSKNVHLKKGNLSSYIITERSDVDFLLDLYGKYSVTEHDGGTSTLSQLPNNTEMEQDITNYSIWKDNFKVRLRTLQATYN